MALFPPLPLPPSPCSACWLSSEPFVHTHGLTHAPHSLQALTLPTPSTQLTPSDQQAVPDLRAGMVQIHRAPLPWAKGFGIGSDPLKLEGDI